MTTFIFFISITVSFFLGWYFSFLKKRKQYEIEIKESEESQKKEIKKLLDEQNVIVDQMYKANALKLEDRGKKLNSAFLDNGSMIETIASELKKAQSIVDIAFSAIPKIYECSTKTKKATLSSKEKIDELSQSLVSWKDSMQALQKIQNLISGIYEKAIQIRDVSGEANLLALNASIEAARAGEHGRGFAVVAECMRDLSSKSAEVSLEINGSVELTQTEVNKIIDGIQHSVSLLTEVSGEVSDRFADIENEVANIDQISQASFSEAEMSKEKFQEINSQVNTQLENITKLLADTLGEVTGNKIENLSVQDDFGGMKIIDVRRSDEFQGELGHLKGAELVCLQDNFEERLKRFDKSASYLFVCRSGGRSSRAARIALGHGFKRIYNMEGGMLEWCKVNGKPVN